MRSRNSTATSKSAPRCWRRKARRSAPVPISTIRRGRSRRRAPRPIRHPGLARSRICISRPCAFSVPRSRSSQPYMAPRSAAGSGWGGRAVSADFRITCPEARFAANFTKLGFHPGFGLTVTLPELVGKNNAELIFYTSRRVTGEEACRMGLANECVPQDQVRERAMKLAQEIAECSPLGLLSTRATMRTGLADRVLAATNHELAEQTRLRATEDFKEGVKATEERRVANFRGR